MIPEPRSGARSLEPDTPAESAVKEPRATAARCAARCAGSCGRCSTSTVTTLGLARAIKPAKPSADEWDDEPRNVATAAATTAIPILRSRQRCSPWRAVLLIGPSECPPMGDQIRHLTL